MRLLKCAIWVFIYTLSFLPCAGQKKGYNLTNYTTRNGLPQNSVKDIDEDRWGFVWLTTEMGLVRFDGQNFKVFGTHNVPGLTFDRMQQIATDSVGAIYVETEGPATIKIVSNTATAAPIPKFLGHSLMNFPRAGCAMSAESLNGLNISQELLNRLNDAKVERLSSSYVGIRPEEGYFLADWQLYYLKNKSIKSIEEKELPPFGLTLVEDYFIKIYKNNRIKVWHEGKLVDHFKDIKGSLNSEASFLKEDYRILWSRNGTFIYCNNNKNLHRIYRQGQTMISELVLENLDVPGMDVPGLVGFCYSREKNIFFFGSETLGLFVVKPASFQYPTVPKGTKSENFYTQIALDKEKFFAYNILFSQKGEPEALTYLTDRESAAHYMTPDRVMYYEKGIKLYSYDFTTRIKKEIVDLDSRLLTVLPNPKKANSLLLFTLLSVSVLDQDSILMKRELQELNAPYRVNRALPLPDGHFLLCTQHGLKWYDLSRNKVTRSILDSINIRTAFVDTEKRIWIGSYGRGFYLFHNNKVYTMPLDRKKSLRTIHSFIDAEPGYFWLPTNDGLLRVSREELASYAMGKTSNIYYYTYDQDDGLRTNEFNGGCDPSYLRFDDGMLSLPSLDGLVWFYPEKTVQILPDKKLFIDHITVNGKPVSVSNSITLDPDFSEFAFSSVTPFFGNKENIHIEYSISGIKNEWTRLPASGEITLNNVRSGDYKIQLRKRTGKTKNDFEYLNLDLVVKPFFYNTWWFYILMIALLVLAIYLFIKNRIKALRAKAVELEALVASRTSQLTEAVKELSISQEALTESNTFKDKMMALVLHDLRSPIRFLDTISNHLSRNYRLLSTDELKESTDELKHSTGALNHFVEQFFAWVSSRQEKFHVRNVIVQVGSLFDEINELYQEILKSRRNTMVIIPTSAACYTDKHILGTVLRNLVDNANKNTRGGTITLSAEESNGLVILSVSDTGRGLDYEQKDKIISGKALEGGMGFTIITDLLVKIGGRLEVDSGTSKGSVFRILIPIHTVHYEA